MKKVVVPVFMAIGLAWVAPAIAAEDHGFAPLDFLVGEWAGTGSGEPGQGSGGFTFTRELQGKAMVRRAHSTYPASNGRPAITHDDLLVVHSGGALADYYDNEGHVIHYRVTGDGHGSATFLSTDPPPAPLFRLTYTKRAGDELAVRFEISQSGKAADLKVYLDGVVKRTAPGPAAEEPPLEDLVGLEAQSWVAWKAQDARFFEDFLADDHLEVGPARTMGKRQVVDFIRSHACEVKSYELSAPTVTQISPTTAVLVYRAEQDTRCGGHPVPSPTWATSVYAFRDGRWRNVLYQQMPAAR